MKWIKTFEEAIPAKKYAPYHREAEKVGYKERYKDIFEDWKKRYDGDRNAYRIFIPLDEKSDKSETQIKVEDYIRSTGIDPEDPDQFNYIEGKYKFKDAKNWAPIGKMLSRNKQVELGNLFASDKSRSVKGKGDLIVCISRHPYDIVGADTDRRWDNCMTLYHYNRFKDAWLSKGANVRYLMGDVKRGSLIAFLIRKDDKNIQDPIANLNIKPYVNDRDSGDIVLVPDNRMYGLGNDEFKKVVYRFCDEINGNKIGYYKLARSLYKDNFRRWGEDDKDVYGEEERPDELSRLQQLGYSKKHLPTDVDPEHFTKKGLKKKV